MTAEGAAGAPHATEERVLVLAPVGRDARLAAETLARAGMEPAVCPDADALRSAAAEGAGAALVTLESLRRVTPEALAEWADAEPAWSELPFVVLTTAPPPAPYRPLLRVLERRRHAAFLERPVPRRTLVSVLRAALESRRRQYSVRDLLAAREREVRQRDHFLAMLSHELRNPLAAIHSATELLHALAESHPAGRSAPEGARAVSVLDRQSSHLARLVDDLLDVSRIARDKLVLRRERVELGASCRYALQAVAPLLEARGHHVEVELPPAPVVVDGDATRIEQILTNLLTNAAKYTPAGGHVSLRLLTAPGGVAVHVADDGAGMTPEFLARAFEPFAQAEARQGHGAGGLGLGLPLARRLAELHGGTLTATSAGLNRGAELVLRLPRADADARLGDARPPPFDAG